MGVLGTIAGYTPVGAAYNYAKDKIGIDKDWLMGTPAEQAPGEFDVNAFNLGGLDRITGVANQGIDAAQGRRAQLANAAMINQGPQAQFRGMEMGLANQLQRIGSGQQMGAGEMAVRRQVAQAMAGQQAAARMRGGNAALAARGAARAIGDLGINAAGQSGMAALNDQSAARGLLSSVLQQGRGADIGLAGQQAQFQQQANLANQSAGLQQQGMNDAYQLAMLGQLTDAQKAQLQAQMQLNQLRLGQGQAGMAGPLLQAGGSVAAAGAMASDRRLKKNVEPGGSAVREFLSKIAPATWDYRDEKHGKGRHAGVMAQDVERSKLGKGIVFDTPEGKMLDGKKALGAVLASVADLHGRLERVEKGK